MSPIPVANSLPERSGILDIDAPKLMDYKMGHKGGKFYSHGFIWTTRPPASTRHDMTGLRFNHLLYALYM
ncbi:hypothetical protein OIU84_022505 [Salix udensis]|uniref:Uncharacterized protein n=1 Tax=Salix udensis TaxID=889485 RepID=A0AAD6KR33_9ROSI|nr:hypothetical protein OIU84_022505 [Salix udensis]